MSAAAPVAAAATSSNHAPKPTLQLANGSTKQVSFLKKHGFTLLKWTLVATAVYLLTIHLWPLVIAGTVGYCIGAFSGNPFKRLYHELMG